MSSAVLSRAVVLAAGLGTRLRPLSLTVPKPLFPILNRPLLGILLEQLQAAGCTGVAINTHHLAAALAGFVRELPPHGVSVRLSHEPRILGTGGGLKQLADFWEGGPCLVINGDILTDIDPAAVFRAHAATDALATLVLHDCPRFNNVWRDDRGDIAGFGDSPPPGAAGPPLAYTGIQVISPRLFDLMPAAAYVDLIATYRAALAGGERLAALVVAGPVWEDIGTPAAYLDLHRGLLAGRFPSLRRYFPPLTDPWLGEGVRGAAEATFGGGVCVGPRATLGNGVTLANTVIWAEAVIADGVALQDCIVGRGVRVTRAARGACLV